MYKSRLPADLRVFRDTTASAAPVGLFYEGVFHTLVVAPATSNTVAKFVYGISDNLATNVFAQAGDRLRLRHRARARDAGAGRGRQGLAAPHRSRECREAQGLRGHNRRRI